MGVQIYLLDRRETTLIVGGRRHKIGLLRRSWKVTEMDERRAAEDSLEQKSLRLRKSPKAVLVADVMEMAQASEPKITISAHLVLGWDADRVEVTDFGWDYLPKLGYGVRVPGLDEYVLYHESGGMLFELASDSAVGQGLLTPDGELVRSGQPTIRECNSVVPYITNYVKADCILSDGRNVEVLTEINSVSPLAGWYVGKRPMDTNRFVRC